MRTTLTVMMMTQPLDNHLLQLLAHQGTLVPLPTKDGGEETNKCCTTLVDFLPRRPACHTTTADPSLTSVPGQSRVNVNRPSFNMAATAFSDYQLCELDHVIYLSPTFCVYIFICILLQTVCAPSPINLLLYYWLLLTWWHVSRT